MLSLSFTFHFMPPSCPGEGLYEAQYIKSHPQDVSLRNTVFSNKKTGQFRQILYLGERAESMMLLPTRILNGALMHQKVIFMSISLQYSCIWSPHFHKFLPFLSNLK